MGPIALAILGKLLEAAVSAFLGFLQQKRAEAAREDLGATRQRAADQDATLRNIKDVNAIRAGSAARSRNELLERLQRYSPATGAAGGR